jgi:tetratricopeptide (TPR) repeat protein
MKPRRTIPRFPDRLHLQALLSEASSLRERGLVMEAIEAYRRLLAAYPGLPDSWYNLAWLLRRVGRADDALAAYAEALARNVPEPEEVHVNRAAIYSDQLCQPRAALEALQEALRLNPTYLPALLNMGNLAEDLGDAAEAHTAYERALQVSPRNAIAIARLAGLGRAATIDDPMIARLEVMLAEHAHAPAEAALLLFALGRLYDCCGAYDQAYRTIESANEQAIKAAGSAVADFDADAEADRADALAGAYSAAGRTMDGILAPDPVPVFIVGMFRSGSSLLEQVLGSHSAIEAGGELDAVPRIAGALGGEAWAQVRAPGAGIREHADAYLRRLRKLHPGARLVTDKQPDNFWHVGLIKRLFPTAKIINTRRHALDNLISVWALYLDGATNFSFRIEDVAGHILAERRMMAHWNQRYPGDILTLEYEELVTEPEAEITRVLSFIGQSFESACLEFHRTSRPVRTASVWQVREPLHDRSIGRWRHYEAALRSRPRNRWLDALLAAEVAEPTR